jgi:Flp pilus assembly protein TadD
VLAKKGLYDEAIAQLRKAIDLAPGEARGHYYLGVCLNHLDRIDEAAQAFERAIEADPNDSKSFHHLGIIWDRKGRTERAREMYRQARAVAGTARG